MERIPWGRGRWFTNTWLRAALILVLAVIVLSWLFGRGGGLVATGLGVVEAIEAQDAARGATYFIEEVREEATLSMDLVFAIVDNIELSNVEWEVLYETEDRASVEVGIDWEATAFGETRSGHVNEAIDLVNVDGEWLISDFSPFEWLLEEILKFEPR